MTDLERLTAERNAWRDLALARAEIMAYHGEGPATREARRKEMAAIDRLSEIGVSWRTGERRPTP